MAMGGGWVACLVRYNGAACCSCVCSDDYTTIEYTSHNGCTGACRLWERDTLGMEGGIAVVVGEVEASHLVCERVAYAEQFRRGYL